MTNPVESNSPVVLKFKSETPQERVVVTFPEGIKGAAQFSSNEKILEEAFKTIGIPIPIQQKDQYPELKNSPNRNAIYLTDASFGKAFYEIYFKQKMNPEKFTWEKI